MAKIDNIDRPTDSVFLLFHFGGEIGGITKVQKMLFLIEKETKFGDAYSGEISMEFKPYKMGPFSAEIYNQVDLLLSMNAITAEPGNFSPSDEYELKKVSPDSGSESLSHKVFHTTSKGHKIGKALAEVLEESTRKDLEETIQYYNSMPLRQLLEYVYSNYEEMTGESEIKEEILG